MSHWSPQDDDSNHRKRSPSMLVVALGHPLLRDRSREKMLNFKQNLPNKGEHRKQQQLRDLLLLELLETKLDLSQQ
jgi:hypothetical protein